MKEAEWLACPSPDWMLMFLRGKASHRKIRLVTCYTCRRIWEYLPDGRSRSAVEVAEQFAEGVATEADLAAAHAAAIAAIGLTLPSTDYTCTDSLNSDPVYIGGSAAASCSSPFVFPPNAAWGGCHAAAHTGSAVCHALAHAAARGVHDDNKTFNAVFGAEEQAQCRELRDVIGNPFRPVTFDPAWRTGTAVALARTMYESSDFSAMPILSDALQDAGCDNENLLNHCRDAKQVHGRGCWVVDLVLGKE